MGANIAGIYGAQIFRQDDKPRYRRGFSVNIAVLTIGLSLAVFRFIDDRLRRRRNAGRIQAEAARERISSDDDNFKAIQPGTDQPQTVKIG